MVLPGYRSTKDKQLTLGKVSMPDTINAAMLVLRVILAVVLLAHGTKHAFGRERTTNWFRWLGFKAPGFQWFNMTATEIAVGVLLLAGLFTSVSVAAIVGLMFVAFWSVHRQAGFFITAFMKDDIDVEGYEYVLTLAVAAVALGLGGPGAWSLDERITIDGVSLAGQLDGAVGLALAGMGLVAGILLVAIFWRPTRAS